MAGVLAPRLIKARKDRVSVPARLCKHDSIFHESFGGFWFEEYLHVHCPVACCSGSLMEGWEYIDTIKEADGKEKLAGQWWKYCPVCGYAVKLDKRGK